MQSVPLSLFLSLPFSVSVSLPFRFSLSLSASVSVTASLSLQLSIECCGSPFWAQTCWAQAPGETTGWQYVPWGE